MFISVFNQGTNSSSKLENPTPETIKELMAAFKGNVAGFHISGEEGYLTVLRGEDDRVKVVYNDMQDSSQPDYNWGILSDPTLMGDAREIEVDYGTETTPEPIYRTIPSERALEIALYFLEHEAPPKGLTWDGRMDRFQ